MATTKKGQTRRRLMGEPTITLRQALLVVALATVTIAFAAKGTRVMRISRNERRIGRLMLSVGQHMTLFRDAGYRDADGDGRGEYSGLDEVGGLLAVPDRQIAGQTRQALHTPAVNELARAAADGDGIADLHGFSIALWLPTGEEWELQRRPEVLTRVMRGALAPLTRTQAPLPAGAGTQARVLIPVQVAAASTPADAEHANARERRFTMIAWPSEWGETADHTYVLTETGVLVRARSSGLLGEEGTPDPDRCRLMANHETDGGQAGGAHWLPVARVPRLR